MGLPAIAQGQATDSGEVTTSANLIASGLAPMIECLWVLPDADADPGTGMDYLDDDDPATAPSPVPCVDLASGQAAGARHLIQIRPNADDLPGRRLLETWTVLTHPAGIGVIDAATWRIYYPEGILAATATGSPVDGADCSLLGATAGSTTLAVGSMFAAAYATGQVANAAITDSNTGIVGGCLEATRLLYRAEFDLSRFQPCGEYRLVVDAVSDGVTATLDGYFDVLCFHQLQLDFAAIDWGTVQPGIPKTLAGDAILGSTPPTVRNGGNGGFNLGLEFAPLAEQVAAGGGVIDEFGAAFGLTTNDLEWIDPIPANAETWFSPADAQTVCAGDAMPLNLTIKPGGGIPAGVYSGTMLVLAMPDTAGDDLLLPFTCNNDNGLWDPANPGAQR